MKKFFLFLALAISSSVFGQTLVKNIENDRFEIIPKAFSFQGKPYLCTHKNWNDFVIFDENFDEVKRFSTQKEAKECLLYDSDYSADPQEFYLSQTLFNNDEKIEYISALQESNEEFSPYLGFEIKSETGDILSTINFSSPQQYEPYMGIIKMNSNVYLVAKCEDLVEIYRIDNGMSTVQKVKAIEGINIMPRMPKRHEVVTVELDDVSDESRELQVVNGSGQMVDRIIVPAGQKQVQLNSAHMSPGINIINVKGSDNKTASAQKIFVK